METSEYKTLDFSKVELTSNEWNNINNLFEKYSEDDIFYEIDDEKFSVHLKNINFKEFEKDVKNITANGLANTKASELLANILNKIESIKSYGLKGNKRIYVDYNKERKVKNRKQKEQNRQPFFYAQDNNFSKENKLLPEKYINKIICDDSKKILQKLPDNCIDIIFTSPPYNFGLEYNANADDHHWQNYFDKLFSIFDECIRVLKFGGRIIVNIQPLFSDYIPSHHLISNYFINKKLIWKSEILWEKNNYNCKYTAWGSWKSPSNPYMKYTWEFLEVFAKGSLKKEGSSINADISADEFKKWVISKWSIAPERAMKEYGHPAMFPEELVVRALKLFSFKNDIVLDPFNGAGTTTFVAKKINRRFLGIDISDKYCKVAENRLNSTFF